ncbi:MAG TPA: glycosyltransferase family 2 protein [Mucilaginibacter sp.]|jgi:glycosyltransferase involved in cell wall biosynthesis
MWKVSAVIITYNEAQNIGRCLKSLEEVAEEIIVVDNFSTDDTKTIVSSFPNARLISQAWLGYGPQKNTGIAEAVYEYILSIDADEELDPMLIHEIKMAKSLAPAGLYAFHRVNYYYTKFLKHGAEYPDLKIRMFPRNAATWSEDLVHEKLIASADLKVEKLNGELLHYTYNRMFDHIRKANKYSSLAAQNNFNQGKKSSWGKILFSPPFTFIQAYFLKRGFLDGANGFIAAAFHAYGTFMKYAKLWELHQKKLPE